MPRLLAIELAERGKVRKTKRNGYLLDNQMSVLHEPLRMINKSLVDTLLR